jgi:hypothetical protein
LPRPRPEAGQQRGAVIVRDEASGHCLYLSVEIKTTGILFPYSASGVSSSP